MIDWTSPKLQVFVKMLQTELYFCVCILPKTLKSHKERKIEIKKKKKKKKLEINICGREHDIRHNNMTILNKLK